MRGMRLVGGKWKPLQKTRGETTMNYEKKVCQLKYLDCSACDNDSLCEMCNWYISESSAKELKERRKSNRDKQPEKTIFKISHQVM